MMKKGASFQSSLFYIISIFRIKKYYEILQSLIIVYFFFNTNEKEYLKRLLVISSIEND